MQENLSGRMRRGPPTYGRPRKVLSIERRWQTRKGLAVHFVAQFAERGLYWTAVEGDKRHRVVDAPSAEDMAVWTTGAELSKVVAKD